MAHFTYRNKAGVKVPSVTTILSGFKDPGALMYWAWKEGIEGRDFRQTRDKAADIGTVAHKLVECHIRSQTFDPTPYPAEVVERAQVPFGAFLEWAGGSKLTAESTEVPMVSEKHQFGGCMDVVLINGRRQISDWKTSSNIYPEMLAQILGYSILFEETFPEKPIDGGYSIIRFDKQGEFAHHWWPGDSPKVKAAREMFLALRIAYSAKAVIEGKDK